MFTKSILPAILPGDGVAIGRIVDKADVHSHQWSSIGRHHLASDDAGVTAERRESQSRFLPYNIMQSCRHIVGVCTSCYPVSNCINNEFNPAESSEETTVGFPALKEKEIMRRRKGCS